MEAQTTEKAVYRVAFVERTGLERIATGRVTVKLLSHDWSGGKSE